MAPYTLESHRSLRRKAAYTVGGALAIAAILGVARGSASAVRKGVAVVGQVQAHEEALVKLDRRLDVIERRMTPQLERLADLLEKDVRLREEERKREAR
jgi:hypothetical protein